MMQTIVVGNINDNSTLSNTLAEQIKKVPAKRAWPLPSSKGWMFCKDNHSIAREKRAVNERITERERADAKAALVKRAWPLPSSKGWMFCKSITVAVTAFLRY